MRWNELIEKILVANKGFASLNYLYEQAPKYKALPEGDWQKTLRGVLYREVNRGTFKRIGLGVYSLLDYSDESTAYKNALENIPAKEYLKSVKDIHSTMEGMLLEIGNGFEYTVYSSDRNKEFDGKKIKDLCTITKMPDFTYPEIKKTIEKADIVWFTKSRLLFPKYIFEIEATTDFTNSLFKMYQLINFDSRFILIASEKRKNVFLDRVNKEPFVSEKNKFHFRSFDEVAKLYFNAVAHYELKTKFLSIN